MTEEDSKIKELIKNKFRQNFEIVLDMFLEEPPKNEEKERDDISLAEYYLKSLKFMQKQEEYHKKFGEYLRRSDIDCQIHYSFYQNGFAI